MATPQNFRENSRARLTAGLKAMEDMVSLRTEYNALLAGNANFIPPQADPIWTNYDMTRVQFMAMLVALDQTITCHQGGAVPADATRPTALYVGKV
jgi:hypothetical protein